VVRKTSTALMVSYITLLVLYCLPIALYFLVWSSAPENDDLRNLRYIGISSPMMAADSVPMTSVQSGLEMSRTKRGDWIHVACYFVFTTILTAILFLLTAFLFRSRWRLTGRG
jgi:hypothetical protein